MCDVDTNQSPAFDYLYSDEQWEGQCECNTQTDSNSDDITEYNSNAIQNTYEISAVVNCRKGQKTDTNDNDIVIKNEKRLTSEC